MKVVVDEGVPRQLVKALTERGIDAARLDQAWRGQSNGALIASAEAAGYSVLLTNDKNIAYQQSLRDRSVAVVALPLNRRSALLSRVDDIADTLRRAEPGRHIVMGIDGSRTVRMVVAGRTLVESLPSVAPFDV